MCAIEESLLLKGFQLLIIDGASSNLGVGVSTEGWPHFIGLMYELNISLLGSLALQGPGIVRLDLLVYSGRPMVVSVAGASLIASSALGGPPTRTPSSKDAQAFLEASWATSSNADRASEAHFGESTIITVRLL